MGTRARTARESGRARLRIAGWTVTVANVRATELACATGVERLEAVVLRRMATGRIKACPAVALFMLNSS